MPTEGWSILDCGCCRTGPVPCSCGDWTSLCADFVISHDTPNVNDGTYIGVLLDDSVSNHLVAQGIYLDLGIFQLTIDIRCANFDGTGLQIWLVVVDVQSGDLCAVRATPISANCDPLYLNYGTFTIDGTMIPCVTNPITITAVVYEC